MPSAPWSSLTRSRALAMLALITAVGAALRFDNLAWGAPYFHFHIDEHFVMAPADLLRRSTHDAAMYPKFFMYSPLLMYLINAARSVYEALTHPLNLTVPRDEVTYMVLGRALSAFLGTLTIPVLYAVGTRVAGRAAGLLSAAFLAVAVLHVRDSHFATTDVSMTFFCVVTLWCALRLMDRGDWGSLIAAGAVCGLAVLTKYAGVFVLGVIGLAYLFAPGRPAGLRPVVRWVRWVARGVTPIVVSAATFLVCDPLVLEYSAKFRSDIKDWVTDPLTGVIKPAWVSQFADVTSPRLYWFTNLMWWSFGPALEIVGLAGVVWLVAKWDKRAAVAAAFPILYFIAASGTIAPFIRYLVPLAPALALAAGVLCADALRHRRLRLVARVVTAVTLLATAGYAFAYMNVFRQPDSRLAASAWLLAHVPADAKIMVEPSHNTPPMGAYLTNIDFNSDYVLFRNASKHDYYNISSLDVYNYLFDRRTRDEDRRAYIRAHLAAVDWIVMDDTFLQFYQHLPDAQHHVVKEYYQDLLAGRLGFELVRTFKVYPSLFGREINDDGAELTFRLFDHPRIFIFKRAAAHDVTSTDFRD